MTEDENFDELVEKAKVLAKATGRSEEDVLADLLDDGVLNMSNREEKGRDLVSELKEAAELINTVQAINKEVSENTVLNGGDNKTEIKVDTTLEGDIVDRAIASAQRKADNIKKLLLTLGPIMLILTGGAGLEVLGVTDWSDDSNDDEPIYIEYGGCLNPDAANYDPEADWDDGSCYWDDDVIGPCYEDWRWDEVLIQSFDANGEGYNNDLQIYTTFNDWNRCNRHMEGYFSVEIWDEDGGFMWNQYQIDNKFHDEYTIDDHHYDMPESDYVVSVDYHFDGSYWEGPSALVFLEGEEEPEPEPEPEPVYGCTDPDAENYNPEADTDDESCTYPPEPCDYISVYSLYLDIFNNSVESVYDLDCDGQASNEAFVMFLVQPYGSNEIMNVTSNAHTVTGAEYDTWVTKLGGFIDSNYTHYNFTWSMTYEDSNGQYWTVYQNWTNVEFEVEEPEVSCDNLSLVPDSLILGKESNNLTLLWELTHDGVDDASCYLEVEISITLYQNGTFYDISEFHKNGIHKVYANGDIYLNSSIVDIFENLSSGSYEVLVKYRIGAEVSQDFFEVFNGNV